MKTTTNSRFASIPAGLSLALLLLLPALAGCVAVAAGASAGAAAVAWVQGQLETTVTADYEKTVEASRAAIKDLEFVKMSDNKDAYSAKLVARTAQDKKVEIELTSNGKKLTDIKIRVGLIGDQPLSLVILEKIKAGL